MSGIERLALTPTAERLPCDVDLFRQLVKSLACIVPFGPWTYDWASDYCSRALSEYAAQHYAVVAGQQLEWFFMNDLLGAASYAGLDEGCILTLRGTALKAANERTSLDDCVVERVCKALSNELAKQVQYIGRNGVMSQPLHDVVEAGLAAVLGLSAVAVSVRAPPVDGPELACGHRGCRANETESCCSHCLVPLCLYHCGDMSRCHNHNPWIACPCSSCKIDDDELANDQLIAAMLAGDAAVSDDEEPLKILFLGNIS